MDKGVCRSLNFLKGCMGRFVAAACALLFVLGSAAPILTRAAAAQGNPGPLEFEVRPSGVESETPDEKLERRLKQRESLFRSICIHCAPGDRFQSNTPFRPFETLGQRPPAERD